MSVALLLVTYNRPEYLKECLESLKHADRSLFAEVLVVDDASTDPKTKNLLSTAFAASQRTIYNEKNQGIAKNLLQGFEDLFSRHEIVISLDSDAIVRNDFASRLLENYAPGTILTGFHSVTRNANGTERHAIIRQQGNCYFKQSVGGINFCINKQAFDWFVKPALERSAQFGGNWDHMACINACGAWCLKESVVDHIGFDSSMNHIEQPDTAESFCFHDLKDVTLFGLDTVDFARLESAAEKCTKRLKFGEVVLLGKKDCQVNSIEDYSRFIVKELHKHVKTTHCLIIQHDGYVLNPSAWKPEWLDYDYIGATWWYKDGMNVGNGGFSLRSKKLIDILATDPNIREVHPEDHVICRTYRTYLERVHGIRFAPEEVADRFSYEGHLQPSKSLNGHFGFHGKKAVEQLSRLSSGTPAPLPAQSKTYIFNQFRGLGDILFLVPYARNLMLEGHRVIWPIVAEYLPIQKHFPDINFMDMAALRIDYDRRHEFQAAGGIVLPFRWAESIQGKPFKDCMRAKYELYGRSHLDWRVLTWTRDHAAESKLFAQLGLKEGDKYNFVNRFFGTGSIYQVKPQINNGLKTVEMRSIPGYTMLDWGKVIEQAETIHSANTSILYMLEMMDVKAPKINWYCRRPMETDFSFTEYLYTKNYKYHL